ncbi:MAG: YggS family pyridoxal phosphate-dependent enzyme [Alphaproteobacteria bacterium]|nr:YggS family pyridoxal phosphate-dependent enzyme [Alphaproteobacteria bacterium]
MDVAEGLAQVRAQIARAAERARRDPAGVELVAVSKRQPSALIREAYAAGHRAFGENYAQELRDKAAELAELPDLRWHAIGPLQTNKAKYVAAVAHAFHALDRAEVARELGRRRLEDPLPCYVEVNVAGEDSKHGVAPEALADLLAELQEVPGIVLVGLMTMPPWGDPEAARPHFRTLRGLAERHGLPGLSMGSTDDVEVAVEEGATIVRVGRSIFGERP